MDSIEGTTGDMQELKERVKRIDLVLATHGEKLLKMEAWGQHLKSIADHASAMALNIETLTEGLLRAQRENHDMVSMLAGKKQVPANVFGWVVASLLLIIIVLELRLSGMDLEASPSGLKLRQLIEHQATKTEEAVRQSADQTEERLRRLEGLIKEGSKDGR